jgi:DNA-binding SARP family transcriptional activator/tetratricopeptide (TPR) repeat protein
LTRYSIRSLGGVLVTDDTGAAISLRSRKHVALLVYLAANDGKLHARDTIARFFWDTSIQRARHSLSQAIYDLRKNLPGAVGKVPGDAIRLTPDLIRLDANEFEAALKSGDLARAVDLYRGPFADNLLQAGTDDFERWLEMERLRLFRLGELVLRRHVRQCDESGMWGEMCIGALRLVKLSPFDEEAHRALMRGLWMHGDAASAVRHYEDVVLPMAADFPDGLSEETRQLVQRIRSRPAPEPWEDNLGELETPFLGREPELETLRIASRDLSTYSGTAILVAGEAGIGKTRLVREFVRSVGLDEITLLESRCYPAEAEVPYGPVVDGLRSIVIGATHASASATESFTRIGHLFPEFEHLIREEDHKVDPAAWRRRLYEEVVGLMRLSLRAQPIIWVVEDVQWMDATSRSLLHYITRRLAGHAFLLVATIRVSRDDELPENIPVSQPKTSELTREVRLAPLTREQIGEILRQAAPDPGHQPALELAQHLAGGNPFFALEVFRAAVGSTTWAAEASRWDPLTDDRLSKVLAIRLKGLSRGAIALLQATAVLERHATPGAVAAVAGLSLMEAAQVSEDLYGRGLLQDRDAELDFVNDIVREYVYAEMTALQRAALHLTAARHLHTESDANAATLARHYDRGEDRANTYRFALRAAREGKGTGGQKEAAAMADLAMRNAANLDEKLVALHLLAAAELESAQLAHAKEHFKEILRLDEAMPPERRVEVKYGLIRAMGGEANWLDAEKILGSVHADIRNISNTQVRLEKRFESLNWKLKVASRNNDHQRIARVRDRISSLHSAAISSGSLTDVGDVTARGSLAAFELFYGSAVAGLETLRNVKLGPSLPEHLQQRVRLLRGLGYQRMAMWDEADYELKQGLESARKTNDALDLATVLTNLACNAVEQGDWEQAEVYTERASKLHEALEVALDVAIPIHLNAANLAFYQGRIRDASRAYTAIYRVAEQTGVTEFSTELQACLGLTSLQLRDADSAKNWARLCPTEESALEGIQERFKVEWFWGFLNRRNQPDTVLSRLRRVEERQQEIDRVSALKIRWLRLILLREQGGHAESTAQVRAELTDVGLQWFTRFAERWLRLAETCQI